MDRPLTYDLKDSIATIAMDDGGRLLATALAETKFLQRPKVVSDV